MAITTMGIDVAPGAQSYESYMVQLMGWNIPAEHMELVHPHWRSYESPSKYWHFGFAFLYTILMFMSLLGNGVVIWIFATTKSLRTPSNVFVVNQAAFDLLMMLEMPMFIISSLFYQRPIGWETGCDVYALLGAVSGIGSAINGAAIAYDRYRIQASIHRLIEFRTFYSIPGLVHIAIKALQFIREELLQHYSVQPRTISFPLDGRLKFGHALGLVVVTWAWTLPFSILPLVKVWGRYVPEGFLTTCSFDYLTENEDTRVFVGSIFTWSYAFPLALIVFFYSRLFNQVRLHEMMIKEQARKMNVKSLQSNQKDDKSVEIRIAKVAFTIFFLFLCSWTPYATVAMIGAFGNRAILTPMSTMIPALTAKIVSCINPWIYAINHPRYRAELLKRAPWCAVTELDQSETTSVATENTVESK